MHRGVAFFLAVVFFLPVISLAAIEAPLDKQFNYTKEPVSVQGGEITDGRDLRNIRWGKHPEFERIVLDIYKGAYYDKGPVVPVPCYFVVEYEYYPFRFTVTLNGIRARNAEYRSFPESSIIEETYLIPYLDDSGIKFAIALGGPVEFEVFELHNPGRIVIDLRELPGKIDLPEVYSLRTATGLGVEDLGYLQEIMIGMGSEKPRILMAEDGKLFFEEGYYATQAKASQRKDEIASNSEGVEFFIEKRGPASVPQ